jgi:hypothetical protein
MLLGGSAQRRSERVAENRLVVDRTVNSIARVIDSSLVPRSVAPLIAAYLATTLATLAALAVLSITDPAQAGPDAWVHAVVVAVFGVLLWLRLRAARRGSRRAQVAVVVIATVLGTANIVEAAIPDLFPGWMRVEMLGITALMAAVLVLCAAGARRPA